MVREKVPNMIVIILAAALVLGIAFYQVIQGLYGAIIMAVLSILCAMMALTYYESLAAMLYDRQPAHADAGALILLFVVPLLLLRLLSDRFLGRNVVMGVWPDRIAGGAVGLVVGIVLTGMLMIAVQMLPMGSAPLGFRPYDDTLQRDQGLAPFYPDEAVVGMVKAFSAGSLGGRPFAEVHDDLLLELFCARNQTVQNRLVDGKWKLDRVGRVDARPGRLAVLGAYRLDDKNFNPLKRQDLEGLPDNPLLVDKAARIDPNLIVIRVQVDEHVRNEEEDWWRLPATHFRLVARDNKDPKEIRSHYPIAYLTGQVRVKKGRKGRDGLGPRKPDKWQLWPAEASKEGLAKIGMLSVERQWLAKPGPDDPGDKLTVDWVYAIGRNETPAYMVFRRTAVEQVPAIKDGAPPRKEALSRIEEVKPKPR